MSCSPLLQYWHLGWGQALEVLSARPSARLGLG